MEYALTSAHTRCFHCHGFSMVRRSKRIAIDHEDDSLSEEVDECSLDFADADLPKEKPRLEEQPWVLKYEPHRTLEVSLNPRKAKEVREIFERMVDGTLSCRLLILSGPSGASKSTLAKCLARELFDSPNNSLNRYVEYLDSSLDNVSQAKHFEEFLDGCRYLVGRNRCMILIEDLPNIFHEETLMSFRNCLRDWIFRSSLGNLPPIVFCLSEVEVIGDHGQRGYYNIENCLTVETVLGRELLNSGLSAGLIRRVKFLPIAKTYIKKLLHQILNSETRFSKRLLVEDLAPLYESGDIRSLIGILEFMSKSTQGSAIKDLMRESQITLFHATGKVIHSSSKTREMPANGDFSLDYESVKMVVDSYHNFDLLHLSILENYQIYNGLNFDLEIAASIVDSLSLKDTVLLPESTQDFAIRATRHELSNVLQKSSRTLPMKFPRHFKVMREQNKVRVEISNYVRYLGGSFVLFADANLIDGYFLPKVKNSRLYRNAFGEKRFLYNRLGGSFKEIYADEDMPVMENELEMEISAQDQFLEDILEAIRQEREFQQDLNSEEESDAIVDSATDADDDLDDTLDDHLLQLSTQRAPTNKNISSDIELLDDPELDFLVSQGKL